MNESDVERRLVAILAADVVGYTRLMGADETGTRARFNGHIDELIQPAIERRRGRVVKFLGDGLLVEFASVLDAVQCAVEIQGGMAERNAPEPDERRIVFRIGVNLGDVIVEGDDIHGEGVNVAARLEALAEPGGICMSRAAHDQVRDKGDYQLEDMGEIEVKNVSRPVHVYRLVAGDHLAPAPRKRSVPRPKIAAPAVLALALGILAVVGWLVVSKLDVIGSDPLPALQSPRLSIAVLPFVNLNGNQDQDYLADALTEDLTTDLSRISGSFVISRSTAATYRGSTIGAKAVARELNVRYLLEGTVRKADGSILVNVTLTDGENGQQVWSERYARTAEKMYAFQNEVTGRIARTLNLELKEAESRQAARGETGNPDATDLALRAWAELWTKPQSRVTNDAALDFVNRALEIDPGNAEANSVAAYAYARAANYGWAPSRAEALKNGIAAGDKAVAADAKNADAFYALGFLYYVAGDTKKSLELMRQCLALNRNHAPAYFFYGVNLIRMGRPREAVSWVERAFKLSPRDPLRSVWYGVIARAQVLLGDDRSAIETAQKGIVANPKHPHNYAAIASAYGHLGELEKAREALQQFLQWQTGITASRYLRNVASDDPAAQDAYERLITGLRKAGLSE